MSATPSSATPPGASGPVMLRPLQPLQDSDPQDSGLGIKRLGKIIRRRRGVFVLTVLVVTAASALFAVYRRVYSPVFAGSFVLLLSDPVNEASSAGREGIGAVATNTARVDLPTLLRVLQSPTVLEPVYMTLAEEFPDTSAPSIDVSLVSAAPGSQNILASGVVQVSGRGRDPAAVRRALQLTEQAYIDWSLSQRREEFTQGIRFLDAQAPALQQRNNELQNQLENFRRANNVVQPLEEATALRGQASELRNRLSQQRAERDRLQRVRADVASGRLATRDFSSASSDNADAGSSTSVTVGVPNQARLEELASLEAQIVAAQSTYKPGNPLLDNLIAARDRLLPELQRQQLETIDVALRQYDETIATTQQQIQDLEGRFQVQPALLRQYEDLQRRLELSQANLDSLVRSRESFQLGMAQNNAPWQVINPTRVNSVPVEPSVPRSLLQGLLLGLAAGTGTALLKDRLDNVFHSPSEVREELKHPLLGHIPFIPLFEDVGKSKKFMLEQLDQPRSGKDGYQRFYYQEALRNLTTNLKFLNSNRPVRSLAITSSVPSEGKSLMMVLLAKTLSELGQRVLLVDMDLRLPQLHHRLGLNNLEGVSTLLTDESRNWRELLQEVPNFPNWQVITAGHPVPDPPRLLGSARLEAITREFTDSGDFDMVLYDTPPALGLADASLIAEHLDGILLLVSLNKVGRELPAEAIKRIELAGSPLLGLVTNARAIGVTGNEASAYSYGYGSRAYYASSTDAAFDPGITLSYYRNGGHSEEQTSRGGVSAWLPTAANRKRWMKSLKRWMGD